MISIKSMTFGYGKKPLFEGLDLSLEPGAVYGLLGLNGAGKTSLLKLIAGALSPSGGSLEVFGRVPRKRSAAHLADVVFVPEDPWAPPVKPKDWLDRYAVFRPAFDREVFARLFREFALEDEKPVSRYSYGQRKKFVLAAALASGARTVLLDEPTNGLDIPSKTQFRRVLAQASDPGRVIVVSTHQVRDLENLIDPVLILSEGKIPFNLDAAAITDRLSSARLQSLEGKRVVHAERDAMGWSALIAEQGPAPDLEMVFNAAIESPERLSSALAGGELGGYIPAGSATEQKA